MRQALAAVGFALIFSALPMLPTGAADLGDPTARPYARAHPHRLAYRHCRPVWRCGPWGCKWIRSCGCPDRYSCYPLYGAYGPYGGYGYWGAYAFPTYSGHGWRF